MHQRWSIDIFSAWGWAYFADTWLEIVTESTQITFLTRVFIVIFAFLFAIIGRSHCEPFRFFPCRASFLWSLFWFLWGHVLTIRINLFILNNLSFFRLHASIIIKMYHLALLRFLAVYFFLLNSLSSFILAIYAAISSSYSDLFRLGYGIIFLFFIFYQASSSYPSSSVYYPVSSSLS